jgi:activator of the mannose operon (transcriptional antiterminator)
MQLSKRENHLLELLIKNDMTLTAQELASFAHVSTKTIYRTIKRINDEFPSGDIIISEVGRGFRLDYEKYLRESREGNVERMDEARNRRNNILLTLLFKSPNSVSISELFEPYFVTETVIIQDLKKMQSFLRTYQLEIRKKKQRLSILGGEKNIRKTVNYLIGQENLINDTFLADAKNVNAYDIDYITSLLEFIEKKLNTTISYPYNINIFSHLYILLKRSREGAISKKIDNTLDASEKKLIVKYQSLYDVSVEVVQRMSGYLGTALAEIESFFLFQ